MIKITGVDEVIRGFNKAFLDIEKATSEAVFVTANQVKNSAVLSIQNESPGHTVFRQRQGGGTYEHMAADRGNAPNTDTGVLASSIAIDFERGDKIAFVGTSIEYGAHLEFGGWEWLEPALEKHKKDFNKNVTASIQRQIGKM